MFRISHARRGGTLWFALAATVLLAACTGTGGPGGDQFGGPPPPSSTQPPPANTLGTGPVKVALILPLTASGNAGAVAQSMRNGVELGMAQFGGDIQVLTRDDAGSATTAQQVAQQAIDEGAEI